EIEAELVEARKAVKTTEYADKRDYGERFFEALRKMHSEDLNEREAARAKLAQAFRSVIDVITLNRDHRRTVQRKIPDGCIYEQEYSQPASLRSGGRRFPNSADVVEGGPGGLTPR